MWRGGKSVVAVVAGFAVTLALYSGIGFIVYHFTNIGAVEWHHYPYYTWASLVTELLRLVTSVILGGFVASRIAGRAWAWHAGAVGAFVLGPMAAQGFPSPNDQPGWYWVTLLAAIIPSAIVGGWLSSRREGATA
jgi:hypothetical protein